MSEQSEERDHLSRRDMLAAAGGAALLGPLAGFGAAAEPSPSIVVAPPSTGTGPKPIAGHGRLPKHQNLDVDVVVVGGGMAGVCAAVAAARNGSSVVLIQDRSVLGGNASSEVRMHCVGADSSGGRKGVDARETGIIEEIRLEDSVRNLQRSPSMWDLNLYERVRAESNITLLLHTHCFAVDMSGEDRIAAVHASRHNTEDLFTIRGKMFIDATGDGRLGAEAGAAFRMGREGRDEFGESFAPPQADNYLLGSTLLFITRKHDRPMPFIPPEWVHKFPTCADLPHRGHNSWEYGYWWVEWGGELNTIKDNERIRDELLSAALGVWDHIKNSGQHAASENWALEWLGFLPGKRESRRFIGEHILTQQEVQRGETFEDGVALGGWPIDLHPPAGVYSPERPAMQIDVPLYNVPTRCLYSKTIRNLLFAGRDISATHVAFGSTRVMATCSVIGQAAGTAAAMCAMGGAMPGVLARDGITELQQRLLKQDAYIIGVSNVDSSDLARKAQVKASSETPEGRAANVVSGVHRGVDSATNQWISDPSQSLPQWIELRFGEPKRLREVHLVFDTGLNRPLTLTQSDGYNNRMTRGAQPETVRDFELHVLDGESSHLLTEVRGNYQRKRVYRFDPLTAGGLRLVVKATSGDPSARLFEIRAYS